MDHKPRRPGSGLRQKIRWYHRRVLPRQQVRSTRPSRSAAVLKKHSRKSKSKIQFDLQPTNREGVFAFRPPPEGFDPLTASPGTLRQRGILLRRPDPAREPHLCQPWARIVGKMAIPSAYDIPVKFVPRSLGSIPGGGGRGISHGDSTWAGAQVSGHWVGVFATWHIPSVTIPAALHWPSSPQELRSSSWVGLSGVGVGHATPILQAGVDHVIDATGKISYLSWVEWYPNLSNYFGLQCQPETRSLSPSSWWPANGRMSALRPRHLGPINTAA